MMISRHNLSMAHGYGRVPLFVLAILLLANPLLVINPARANHWAALAADTETAQMLVQERANVPPDPAIPLLWSGFWNSIDSALTTVGSERRMLQVATIGMCLALYIMMRK